MSTSSLKRSSYSEHCWLPELNQGHFVSMAGSTDPCRYICRASIRRMENGVIKLQGGELPKSRQ